MKNAPPDDDEGLGLNAGQSSFATTFRSWAPKLLVIAGVAPVNFALVIPRPVLKAVDAELGGSASSELLLKMIIAIIGLSVVVGAPVAGALVRKFGQRLNIVTALALFVVAGCAPYILHDLYSIVASRAILGFAVASIQVSAIALAGEHYTDEERPKILGFMMAGASFAALVLGPLSGLLGEFGWRAPFLLYLAGIPFILLALTGLPRHHNAQAKRALELEIAPSRTRFPYQLVGLGFIAGCIMTLPPIYLSFRLGDIGITSPATIGISFIAISIPEMICASFYGYLRHRISNDVMCMLGFGCAALGLCLIGLAPVYIGILAGMALMGPAIAFLYASIMEKASLFGEQRSRVVGAVISAIYLSLVAGTFAVEPVFLAFGASGVMLGLATLGTIMIMVLFARKLTARDSAFS